jgi:hypothetical protein
VEGIFVVYLTVPQSWEPAYLISDGSTLTAIVRRRRHFDRP